MSQPQDPHRKPAAAQATRRQFLAGGAALGIGSAVGTNALAASLFVQGSDTIRVGLIGCGGRGTGAAADTLKADPATHIFAMGDLFADRLESSETSIREKFPERCDVSDDRRFVGFDAYRKVLAQPIDMVILTTPPYFRSFHLAAAVAAGKHVFFEKPVAVDPAGIRRVIAAGAAAKEKGLCCVVGTQRRHDQNYLDAMDAIKSGEIGQITGASVFWCQGGLWHNGRETDWSEVEYQIRNWLYFSWLSGDQIIEQHIHNIDVALWAFDDERPESVFGSGGRTVRTDELYGNVYDHMDCTFTMSGGRKIASRCRQWPEVKANWVGEEIYGTRGWARLNETKNGNHLMDYNGKTIRAFDVEVEPYVQEHIDLIDAIRQGKHINHADRIANTNLAAIMGRESAYSGEVVRHDWARNESQLRLGPEDCDELAFGPMEVLPVPIPGSYQLS